MYKLKRGTKGRSEGAVAEGVNRGCPGLCLTLQAETPKNKRAWKSRPRDPWWEGKETQGEFPALTHPSPTGRSSPSIPRS